MTALKIVADENIPDLDKAFAPTVTLYQKPGREICHADLISADAIFVRSVTKIDQHLLGGTAVKFVGSATSGVDHIDTGYLENSGIHFATAPGANANAVVDYVLSCIAYYLDIKKRHINTLSFGIIGAGNVGGLLCHRLVQQGIDTKKIKVCDPFLSALPALPEVELVTLEQALQSDVVSLHTPLTTTGEAPTLKLLTAKKMELLPASALLINAARGGVVDEDDLLHMLKTQSDISCIVDVWCNEPYIRSDLLAQVALATPHIAGYSKQAKQRATSMLLNSFRDFFRTKQYYGFEYNNPEIQTQSDQAESTLSIKAPALHWQAYRKAFAIEKLSHELKASALDGSANEVFDQMRKRVLLSRSEI